MARKKQKMLTLFPEVLTITRKFSDEQFGVLMRAAFAYRLEGSVYMGDDAAVDVAFQVVSNQIDRYLENCETNAKNAGGKNSNRKSAESSEMQQNTADAPIEQADTNESSDNSSEEVQNPPPSRKSESVSLSIPSPYPTIVVADDSKDAATVEEDRKLKLLNGTLGKGKVVLSDAQIKDLLDQMGLEMFDYYVDKLPSLDVPRPCVHISR